MGCLEVGTAHDWVKRYDKEQDLKKIDDYQKHGIDLTNPKDAGTTYYRDVVRTLKQEAVETVEKKDRPKKKRRKPLYLKQKGNNHGK